MRDGQSESPKLHRCFDLMDLESSSPFNEKWKSTRGAGGGGGKVKENYVLLLAGS